jgi:hypothetical protein
VEFRLYALRLEFVTRGELRIPASGAGNLLRGAFGAALYRNIPDAYRFFYEPPGAGGPSGLTDRPRPFVFRAAHLDGSTLARAIRFHVDLHLFDMREPWIEKLKPVFGQLMPADLLEVTGEEHPLVLPLAPLTEPANRVTVRFLTPTEMKSAGALIQQPDFGVLACRIRDRLSTLRQLYDSGPLDLDFRSFGERAAKIRMTRCDIRQVSRERTSAATGQTHPLGGFVGEAEYSGDLGEFIPFLRAAQWTGVGRQTAWGKGAVLVYTVPEVPLS